MLLAQIDSDTDSTNADVAATTTLMHNVGMSVEAPVTPLEVAEPTPIVEMATPSCSTTMQVTPAKVMRRYLLLWSGQ